MFANVDGLLDALAAALEVEEVEVTVRNRPGHHLGFTVVVNGVEFARQASLEAGLKAAVTAAKAGEFEQDAPAKPKGKPKADA